MVRGATIHRVDLRRFRLEHFAEVAVAARLRPAVEGPLRVGVVHVTQGHDLKTRISRMREYNAVTGEASFKRRLLPFQERRLPRFLRGRRFISLLMLGSGFGSAERWAACAGGKESGRQRRTGSGRHLLTTLPGKVVSAGLTPPPTDPATENPRVRVF